MMYVLSPQLLDIIGNNVSSKKVLKLSLMSYIIGNQLYDPIVKKIIRPDYKLAKIVGTKRIKFSDILQIIEDGLHILEFDPADVPLMFISSV